jgi:hypothetical protein
MPRAGIPFHTRQQPRRSDPGLSCIECIREHLSAKQAPDRRRTCPATIPTPMIAKFRGGRRMGIGRNGGQGKRVAQAVGQRCRRRSVRALPAGLCCPLAWHREPGEVNRPRRSPESARGGYPPASRGRASARRGQQRRSRAATTEPASDSALREMPACCMCG